MTMENRRRERISLPVLPETQPPTKARPAEIAAAEGTSPGGCHDDRSHHLFPVEANGIVRGELLDAFIEMVVHARGPAARAAVISELVREMCATVEWLHLGGSECDDSQVDELTSITRLSRAAQDHQRQMSASKHKGESATLCEALRFGPEMPTTRRDGTLEVTHAPGLPNDARVVDPAGRRARTLPRDRIANRYQSTATKT